MISYSLKKFAPLIFIVVFIIFVYLLPKLKDVRCEAYKELKEKSFEGLILNHYVDSTEHGYPIIVLMDKINHEIKLNLLHDKSGLFSFVKNRDLLINYKVIVKCMTRDTVFIMDYDCK